MKNSLFNNLKVFGMLTVTAGLIFSCSRESMPELMPSAQILGASAASCEAACIEPGSTVFYPISDQASQTSGINTKSVSYTAYNSETDFVVEVTYAITAGPSRAKATIKINIEGNELEYTGVSSGSIVSHAIPLAENWGGCDDVAFSIVQEGLGAPISFNSSYDLIPVCPQGLEIGMEYQGGIIAYIFSADDPGYIANEIHGLIVSSENLSNGIEWGCYSFTSFFNITDASIGSGMANTEAILQACSQRPIAASEARAYNGGGYSDWYLPSKDELAMMFANKDAIGGIDLSNLYWSSTEYEWWSAWTQGWNPLLVTPSGKNGSGSLRAMRTF